MTIGRLLALACGVASMVLACSGAGSHTDDGTAGMEGGHAGSGAAGLDAGATVDGRDDAGGKGDSGDAAGGKGGAGSSGGAGACGGVTCAASQRCVHPRSGPCKNYTMECQPLPAGCVANCCLSAPCILDAAVACNVMTCIDPAPPPFCADLPAGCSGAGNDRCICTACPGGGSCATDSTNIWCD